MIVIILSFSVHPGFLLTGMGASNISEPQPDYRSAVDRLEDPSPDCLILTNRPTLLEIYDSSVDYDIDAGEIGTIAYTNLSEPQAQSLRYTGDPNVITHDPPLINYYTGSPVLKTSNEMIEMVQSYECGYVIYNPYLGVEGKEYIENNMELVTRIQPKTGSSQYSRVGPLLPAEPSGDDEVVYIYRWDRR
jgi:hypothetical protein